MTTDRAVIRSQELADKYEKSYGHQSASLGRFTRPLNVIPSGSLALDYALGTGGWPLGHIVEVYGIPDIGKTELALIAMREAQKLGKVCALVAVEPGFDPAWAEKHGVDLDRLIVGWPDDGQEAMEMLYDFVLEDHIDYIVFDSIAQVQRPSEIDQKTGKPSMGGASGLLSWGVQRILMPCWKRNKGVMLLNQVRDDMQARIPGMLRAPGGHAITHSSQIIVQLKPGKERYQIKEEEGDVTIGRELVAVVQRNKLAEGTGFRARFDVYSMETEDHPFGIDIATDVINTAIRAGVIEKSGAMYSHSTFPKATTGKKAIRGKEAVEKHFATHPEAVEAIRKDVLAVMQTKVKAARERKEGNGQEEAEQTA